MKTLTTVVLALLLTVGCSATGQVQANDDYFSQAELDSMLAPVALYPDSVLSHVLIAATYPLEVIQAARWSREHPGLRGEDAVAAVEYQDWDASVKALVAFPDLLQRMDEDLQWTQDLGDAFLIQEEDVIASIQYLRSEAYSQGHLRSNDRVKVVREREYIYIEPARTRVVYLPYYDPRVIYTNWRWSSYRPHYWHRPVGYSVGVSFYWGHAYHIRPSFYFSSFHWPTRKVVVVNHHHHYYNGHRFHSGRDVARFSEARHWRHDPTHRRGVSYRGQVAQTRFVDNARSASARVERSATRAVARSEKREWAAQRRSSTDFDRRIESRSRGSDSRVERAAESRLSQRSETRAATRSGRSETRSSTRRSEQATLGSQRDRTVSGSAPARAEPRARGAESSRAPASRVTESLRSRSSSRTATYGSSRGADRSASRSSRAASSRAIQERGSRSSAAIPRDLTVRSTSGRERSSSQPSRTHDFSRGSSSGRETAPSRSRSGGSASAPARSAPRVRSSAPNRSSKSSTPSRSRAASSRSSRDSSSSRSRGGEERR